MDDPLKASIRQKIYSSLFTKPIRSYFIHSNRISLFTNSCPPAVLQENSVKICPHYFAVPRKVKEPLIPKHPMALNYISAKENPN